MEELDGEFLVFFGGGNSVGEKMEKLMGGIWIGGFLGLQGPESNVVMR